MKTFQKKPLFIGIGLLLSFVIWTVLVSSVDVGAIGPRGGKVGFSTLNGYVHALTGVSFSLYLITDILGFVPILTALGFAVLGLFQTVKRKSILRADRSLIALGVFYAAVVALYILFELVVINERPVLIDGVGEASYPSSTTLLVGCVMPTAMMQIRPRVKSKLLRRCLLISVSVFIIFTVLCRFLSGVHWITDIIGGALLSAGLVTVYYSAFSAFSQ